MIRNLVPTPTNEEMKKKDEIYPYSYIYNIHLEAIYKLWEH